MTPLSPGPCSLIDTSPEHLKNFKDLFVASLLLSDDPNFYCRVITDDKDRYGVSLVPTEFVIGDDSHGRYYPGHFRVTTAFGNDSDLISPPGCWMRIEELPATVTAPVRPSANPNGRICDFTCTFTYYGLRQTATIPGTGQNSIVFHTDSFDGLASMRGFEVMNLGCQLMARRFDTSVSGPPWDARLSESFLGNYFKLESDSGGGLSKTVDHMNLTCSAPM